jgi:hypothetical protein
MREITIKTIEHSKQLYDTCGYWAYDDKDMEILVSKMENPDYEFFVGIHEVIEGYLCARKGVTTEEVDEWDMWYEEAREMGTAPCGCRIAKTSEPGDDTHCPYRDEHAFATKIEKMLIKKTGLSWIKYDKAVNEL